MTDLAAITCTADDLAALAGVTARHIRRLGLPKVGRNRYRLAAAIPALIENMAGGDAGAELTKERIRLTAAQADKAELEYAKAKGDVAPIAELQRGWDRLCAVIQSRMMKVPERVVLQIVGETDEAKVKAAMRDEIKQALTDAAHEELTLDDEEQAQDDDDGK